MGAMPRLNGDFDGDGRKDVVYASDKEGLIIVFQRSKEISASADSLTEEVPVSKKMIVEDVDGDGLSDIIMFYPFHDFLPGVVRLLHSTGKIIDQGGDDYP